MLLEGGGYRREDCRSLRVCKGEGSLLGSVTLLPPTIESSLQLSLSLGPHFLFHKTQKLHCFQLWELVRHMYKSDTRTVTIHDILGSFNFMILIDLLEVVLLTHG